MPSFLFWQKRNNPGKGALNLLDWSETCKIEIHPTRILPELKIHSPRILLNPVYTRPVFNLPARTDRSNIDLYVIIFSQKGKDIMCF